MQGGRGGRDPFFNFGGDPFGGFGGPENSVMRKLNSNGANAVESIVNHCRSLNSLCSRQQTPCYPIMCSSMLFLLKNYCHLCKCFQQAEEGSRRARCVAHFMERIL